MRSEPAGRVVIIGAGIGGLAAAIWLATAGLRVTVIEAAVGPGGKLREVSAGGRQFDAGPTVLTMRWVFDELFAHCGRTFEEAVALDRSDVIARHVWTGGAQLDLFADVAQSRAAIADFAGAREADGFERFAHDSARIYRLLKDSFIDAERPNPISLSSRIGFGRPAALLALKPFSTMASALSHYFEDPRLRQLFGRYATYCGSSPFLSPATLMLVAHVEQAGVWIARKGMHDLARTLAGIAREFGVTFHFGEKVERIVTDPSGRAVSGVVTDRQAQLPASAIIHNGDAAALAGLIGNDNGSSGKPGRRSLSALVACGMARPAGVELAHHTVFFSDDYPAEFKSVFRDRRPPADPTVYVCAQDRSDTGLRKDGGAPDSPERIYCLMNMPADGDRHSYSESEIEQCLTAMERRCRLNGLTLQLDRSDLSVTTPDRFGRLFPATGGALYGMASHGWMASFQRPPATGPLRGLYQAGGSAHPGPGVPMAALSGKIAAQRLLSDRASTGRSRPVAITGGMPTASAIAETTHSS